MKQLCCGAKFAMTFGDASPEVMLLTAVLLAAALGSIVIWALALRRLARSPGDLAPRTLATLDGWRGGGPLIAAAGAAHVMMNFFVAVYAYAPVTSYQEYAPGLAEAAMILWAGFQAGGIAALCGGHLRGHLRQQA